MTRLTSAERFKRFRETMATITASLAEEQAVVKKADIPLTPGKSSSDTQPHIADSVGHVDCH